MWRVLLHDARSKRLYVTAEERVAFLAAAAKAARPVGTSCGLLHHAGSRSGLCTAKPCVLAIQSGAVVRPAEAPG